MKISDKGYLICPQCGGRTKVKVIPLITELKQFPLWCPWCKREILIDHK